MANRFALMIRGSLLLAVLFLLTPDFTSAQRNVTYMDLVRRSESPNVYTTRLTLPSDSAATSSYTRFAMTFRIKNSYLTFKKRRNNSYSQTGKQPNGDSSEGSGEQNFYAPLQIGLEVYHYDEEIADLDFRPGNQSVGNRQKDRMRKYQEMQELELSKLEPAARTFWKDTAYAKSYRHTSATDLFVNGGLDVSLKPGKYLYVFTIEQGNEADTKYNVRRFLRIKPMDTDTSNVAYYTEDFSDQTGKLLNIGNRIFYGQDFYAHINIPDYKPETTYELKVREVGKPEKDDGDPQQSVLFEKELTSKEISQALNPDINNLHGSPVVNLEQAGNAKGYTFASVKIPGSTFPNTFFALSIKEKGADKPIFRDGLQSLWINMPKSLLNLNVALNMMRFIVPEKKLKELKDGDFQTRKEKFNKFWAEKDPTPETKYNELMAEYYRRIDYVFREFGSIRIPGYKTDQGKVYIQYGPPGDTDLSYPSDGRSVQVWKYPEKNLKFVFRATSGFGEYKLVNKEPLRDES